MKQILTTILLAAIALTALSCTKKSGSNDENFRGKWYVQKLEINYQGESLNSNVIMGTGNEYWEFKKNGTVVIVDPNLPPEVNNGSAPKPFVYDSEARTLVIDGVYSYEILSKLKTNFTIKSHFPSGVWDDNAYLVIEFVSTNRYF